MKHPLQHLKNCQVSMIWLFIVFPIMLHAQWVAIGEQQFGENAFDRFGESTSLDTTGTIMAVGVPFATNLDGDNSGVVYVYQNSGDTWTQMGNRIDGLSGGDEFGTSVSLSADGTTLAIGAPDSNQFGFNNGYVAVYQWAGTEWLLKGNVIEGDSNSALSGFSVAINADGSRVVIGEPGYDSNMASNIGRIRVFEFQTDTWQNSFTQVNKDLNDPGGVQFGYSVAINMAGDVVAGGAMQGGIDPTTTTSEGHVQVFSEADGSWNLMGDTIYGEDGSRSGWSLDFNDTGNRIAIGSPDENFGEVDVYEFQTDSWVQMGLDIEAPDSGNQFGQSVAFNGEGTVLAVGDNRDSNVFSNGGVVRVFQWDGISWNQVGEDVESQQETQWFGWSVSLNQTGDILGVSAVLTDTAEGQVGSTQVYEFLGTLNTNSIQPREQITIYPNPVSDFIHIHISQIQINTRVQLFDFNGRLIYQTAHFNQNNIRIPMQSVSVGVYILKISNSLKSTQYKIIKN